MTLIEQKRTQIAGLGSATLATGAYRVRLAQTTNDVRKAQQLRFEVFNLELGEGLAASHALERDVDAFDEVCDHLIVEEIATGEVVGTYRLQTGAVAAANIGYYSEREFSFSVYESLRSEMIELGRACVHKAHRSFNLLHLLWRGIAKYALERRARFLVGCSSLTSQDPLEGAAMFQQLRRKFLVKPVWQTYPQPIFGFPCEIAAPPASKPPKLFRAYLTIGAKICGPPAIDREFGTIDFLTLLDLRALPMIVQTHFFK